MNKQSKAYRTIPPKVRDSRYELLRIIAMLMILLQHPLERCFNGEWGFVGALPFCANYVGAVTLSIWGQLGVMLFVIISAWFMTDRQGIRGQKIIMLFLQVWTTCILELVVIGLWHPERLHTGLLIKELLTPIYRRHYWFITAFLAFFITVPLLQRMVQSLTDQALRSVCLVMTVLIPLYNYLDENVGGALADFCYIFLVTAYLKRKPDNWFRRHCAHFWIGMAVIVICFIGVKLVISPKFGDDILLKLFMLRGRTLLLFLVAIELFYCFERMKPIYSKVINLIGSTMFGVYLIHENYLLRGEENGNALIWNDLLHIDHLYQKDSLFILRYVGIVLTVFTVCILLELLRQNLIERLYRSNRLVARLGERFDHFYSNKIF